MKLKKKYHIIFPLSALSIPMNLNSLVKYLIDYALIELGDEYNISDDTYMLDEQELKQMPKNFDATNGDEGIVKAADLRGITIKNLNITKRRYALVKSHKESLDRINGEDARVMMKTKVLLDAADNSLTEKEFRVLCAVYSVLGRSKCKIIYNSLIRYRAIGFKCHEAFYNYKFNHDKLKFDLIMSNEVLKPILDILCERGFFDRYYDGRKFYYSKTLRGDELKKYVLKKVLDDAEKTEIPKLPKVNLSRFRKEYINILCNPEYTPTDIKKIKKKMISKGRILTKKEIKRLLERN